MVLASEEFTTLTIRNVPAETVKTLKSLARSNKRSIEQEGRDILRTFLAERFVAESRRFMSEVSQGLAPAVWEAALASVVWMAIRQGVLTPEEGPKRLGLAARLGIHSVPSRTLWQGALIRAVSSGVAVHDTLFVELAVRQELPLTTFDRKVLKMFPAVASRPGDLIPQ